MTDWRSDLIAREPKDSPAPDPAAEQRILLAAKCSHYEAAAIRWCRNADAETCRANRWRAVAIVAVLVEVVLVGMLLWGTR